MDEKTLSVNDKLFSFKGVIGRHDYLLNLVIICALSTLVIFPYTTYAYSHAQSLFEVFDISKVYANTPILLKLWVLFGTACVCTLSVSNIYRRLNDIFGEVKSGLNIALCSLSVISSFFFLIPIYITIFFAFFSFIFGLILLFKKGKITGALPYDYKKEFNWGAFFGTWIWGLFNKSYITLFELILWFTPLGFYFQLYCGLKGNEWAFKNKNCTDVDAFNKSQKTYTLIFTLLSLVVLPVLYFLFVFALIVAIGLFVANDSNPNLNTRSGSQVESKLDRALDGFINLYFDRFEITQDENKFYVPSSEWNSADFKDKKDMIEMAATRSAQYRRNEFKAKYPDKTEYFSKSGELSRTKIYSSETGKLLGEFVMDEHDFEGSFTRAFKAALKAYRFYNAD